MTATLASYPTPKRVRLPLFADIAAAGLAPPTRPVPAIPHSRLIGEWL